MRPDQGQDETYSGTWARLALTRARGTYRARTDAKASAGAEVRAWSTGRARARAKVSMRAGPSCVCVKVYRTRPSGTTSRGAPNGVTADRGGGSKHVGKEGQDRWRKRFRIGSEIGPEQMTVL